MHVYEGKLCMRCNSIHGPPIYPNHADGSSFGRMGKPQVDARPASVLYSVRVTPYTGEQMLLFVQFGYKQLVGQIVLTAHDRQAANGCHRQPYSAKRNRVNNCGHATESHTNDR